MESREVRRDPRESLWMKGTGTLLSQGQESLLEARSPRRAGFSTGRGQRTRGTIIIAITVKVGAARGHRETTGVKVKVKGHYRWMGPFGAGVSVGAGASYRVTWDPCSTRLTLWETQMGEGSSSV